MRHEISQELHFNYRVYQNKIKEIDRVTVDAHNQKYPKSHPYHFCEKMEPCPFEGNLANAKVILLLGNPHYQPTQSSPKDHVPIDGWGVWGFSENTASSMHGWWRPRLRSFVNDYESEEEWKALSHKVASFQTIAWASQRFYDCSQLPSKGLMAQVLRDLIHNRSDVIFVVMRNKKYWEKMFAGTTGKVIYTKNPRCSYLTKNNLTDSSDWHLLIDNLLTKKI
jgi:hypothetical protein